MKRIMSVVAILIFAVMLTACQSQPTPASTESQKVESLKYSFDDEKMIDVEKANADIDSCNDIATLKESLKKMVDYANATRTVANGYQKLLSLSADMLDNINELFDRFLTIEQQHEKYSEVFYQYKDLAKEMHEKSE